MIEHPAFNNDDLERLRKQRLIGFQQEGDSVNAIAGRVGPKMVYGDHPYGVSASGHCGEREDADCVRTSRASMRSHYGPKDSALVLAGDVTLLEAKALAEQVLRYVERRCICDGDNCRRR